MKQPIADRYLGAAEVEQSMARLPVDPSDHWSRTQALIRTYHPKRLHLTVAEVIDETPSTRTFRLRGADGEPLPPFLAGQYVAVYVDGTSRPYAMSSSPAHADHYDLTVKRVAGGRISNLLIDSLAVGDAVLTSGPMGTFFHNPLFHGDDVVFLAGGSGVVPAMSMIREILDRDLDRRLHLVYGSRTDADVIFLEELSALDDPRITVDLIAQEAGPAWSGASGFITTDAIGELRGRMVYVCGPQALYPYALTLLDGLGHPRRRVRFEANGPPADPTVQPGWPRDVEPTSQVTVRTRSAQFTTGCDRPLLDALEDHGQPLESACRSGECSLCRVRVLSGEVFTAEESKPRRSDEGTGYVHACVTYPLTDVELDA